MVLNETALVVYLNESVTLMRLSDDPANVTFTEIMPLKTSSWWTSYANYYYPTYIVGDTFYSISDTIEWIDLE